MKEALGAQHKLLLLAPRHCCRAELSQGAELSPPHQVLQTLSIYDLPFGRNHLATPGIATEP